MAHSSRRWLGLVACITVAAVSALGWRFFSGARHAEAKQEDRDHSVSKTPVASTTVEVICPQAGGIDRVCIQPGTVEPFEAADLYAKVSGFLIEQSVDIGSRVNAGQVLAKIAVPEAEKQVEREAAKVQHDNAIVQQMHARIAAAEAEAKSAAASVGVAKSQVKAKASYRRFREKQLARLKELHAQRAIDAKLVDESEDQFEAAVEAESAATETVTANEQRLVAAQAKITQSKADLDEATAQVKVAVADWERSKVTVDYSVITSPYDGVVTKRSFNRGDFIRSADAGGERVPLFKVERTDKMRVVVQVPDRDVPFTNAGDAAIVEIDALPSAGIKTVIARVAESEDTATRTMRTEIDVPNPDGKLRHGMYGRVTLKLEVGKPGSMTIPSTALASRPDGAHSTVRVVRDGVVKTLPVTVGADNGIRVEIFSGLVIGDRVIVRASGPVSDGTPVTVTSR